MIGDIVFHEIPQSWLDRRFHTQEKVLNARENLLPRMKEWGQCTPEEKRRHFLYVRSFYRRWYRRIATRKTREWCEEHEYTFVPLRPELFARVEVEV